MWAAMNGHTEVVKALIEQGANVDAKEKVRRRCCICTGVGANDQRMLAGRFDLGAAGRKSPMHCSCGLCTGTN
jgi:ankyrin repeat protein